MLSHINKTIAYIFFIFVLSILSGCQIVHLRENRLSTSLSNKAANFLTSHRFSESSQGTLHSIGFTADRCLDDPDQCVSEIQKHRSIEKDQLYAAASEIYLAKASLLEQEQACIDALANKKQLTPAASQCIDQHLDILDKSIRYSYIYLFKSEQSPQERLFDHRQMQVRSFYNVGLSKLMTIYFAKSRFVKFPDQIDLGGAQYVLNFAQYPDLKDMPIDRLRSSFIMGFTGFYSVNRQDGLGAEFVAVKSTHHDPEEKKFILDPEHHYQYKVTPNIHTARYLPVTAVTEPVDMNDNIEKILSGSRFEIRVIDPYRFQTANINQHNYIVTANYSAPMGLWLAENKIGSAGYWSLLNREQRLVMPHLFMIEPYQPNKKVIVMIHGLGSSPEAWVSLMNNIMGDRVLRDNYQVWQIFYSTNMPIFESRFQIYALLKQAFAQTQPHSASAKDAVIIGHSMGGVISRLLVSQGDVSAQAIPLMSEQQKKQLDHYPIIQQRFLFKPIPQFTRAVFIAAPQKGTPYANRWFTQFIAKKIIRLPQNFINSVDANFRLNVQQFKQGLIYNGPGDLSDKSKFMLLTSNIEPVHNVAFHSIMGNTTHHSIPVQTSDGIVPYSSSHLDGAVSEKIIHGGHSIQETSEAVFELRRILRLHLGMKEISEK
nr:alpha/beta fold hydrolase [Acinetobacter sp. Marseille-Q1620]